MGSKPETTHLFLAEGEAEVGFIETYLESLGTSQDTATIVCFAGVNRIAARADSLAKFVTKDPTLLSQISGIGFVADAEDNPEGRVDAAIQVAKSFGFQGGAQLKATGSVAKGTNRYAYYIAPGGGASGRIEDVILEEIGGTALYGCIEGSFECIQNSTGVAVDSKAAVQMFISAKMNNSMAGIRAAFAANVFDVHHAAYDGYRGMVDTVLQGH